MEDRIEIGDIVQVVAENSEWKGSIGKVTMCGNSGAVEIRIRTYTTVNVLDSELAILQKYTPEPFFDKPVSRHGDLKKKVMEVMRADDCKNHYENLATAFFDSVNGDDEQYHKIGYYLLKAFLEDDVDAAMTALCGWSLENLMVMAKILPDTEKIFYDEPIEPDEHPVIGEENEEN